MNWGRQGLLRENKMKLNLPSADQHPLFFSAKPIKSGFIAKHCFDNWFLVKVSKFFFPAYSSKRVKYSLSLGDRVRTD